uniref:Ral GEF with PH domain and SH3 binding motif 1 n=1 Tax=Erpetoichthys calabaricus TaxID=27687 RepID=A0A8C4SB18_ERPCA
MATLLRGQRVHKGDQGTFNRGHPSSREHGESGHAQLRKRRCVVENPENNRHVDRRTWDQRNKCWRILRRSSRQEKTRRPHMSMTVWVVRTCGQWLLLCPLHDFPLCLPFQKLQELNNLHSLVSVVSALQSAPIFRLTKTWALISRRDKTTFEKLDFLMSKEDNYSRMREYMRTLRMVPCIPYLGIYLLDIIYIDSAYPASDSIMENEQRSNQMNNILRIISDLQVSCNYDHLMTLSHVQKYLMSVRYIEELQKFVEDDNYKLSLKIEPGNSSPRLASSKEDLAGRWAHRGYLNKCEKEGDFENCFGGAGRALLYDNCVLVVGVGDGGVLGRWLLICFSRPSPATNFDSKLSFSLCLSFPNLSPMGTCPSCLAGSTQGVITIEGPLRRKTLLKEGRKPTLPSWTRYWITLSGTTLIYYGAKALRATERKHYKSTPSKKVSISGWMPVLPDDPEHPDIFQLNDPDKGNVYKFQTASRFHAILWHKHLEDACRSFRPQVSFRLLAILSKCFNRFGYTVPHPHRRIP